MGCRVRAFEPRLPQSAAGALARVGGRGFGGAFLMGLVAGLHRRACTMGLPLAGLLAYSRRTRERGLRLRSCAPSTALGVGLPFLLLAAFSITAALGALDGVGQELLSACPLTAALTTSRHRAHPSSTFTSRESCAFAGAHVGVRRGGVALGAIHLSLPTAAAASAPAKGSASPRDDRPLRPHRTTSHAQGRERSRVAVERAGAPRRRARANRPMLVDFRGQLVPALQRSSSEVSLAPRIAEADGPLTRSFASILQPTGRRARARPP